MEATDENISRYAFGPMMRLLIGTALDGSTMTYGAISRWLQAETGLNVIDQRIGPAVGALMRRIQQVDANAPLINALVVNQKDRQPSEGIGEFMADRFGKKLRSPGYKKRHPAKWEKHFRCAAAEVYATTCEKWAALYEKVFDEKLPKDIIAAERKKRHNGNEDDFGSRKYGSGGESEFHKSLRIWVTENPRKIDRSFAGAKTETEFFLDSGDRIDAVYNLDDRTIVLEVKSRISDDSDLRRGVYQCVKYRAVKTAMDVRKKAPVEAMLITEKDPPGEIKALLKLHKIRHFKAPMER